MRNALIAAVAAAALLAGPARAEEEWVSVHRPTQSVFILNWEIAGPIGPFSNYIDDTSLRGLSFENRYFLRDTLSLGFSFSWNRFEQTFDRIHVPIANGMASGPVFRYADMFGIRALAHYYLNPGGQLKPYVGFGIGGVWSYAYQQVTDLADSQDSFEFIVDPEIGLLYWFSPGSGGALNIALRYTYTTAKTGREDNAQTLSGIVGVAFGY